MEVEQHRGLRILAAEVEEALAGDWAGVARDADLVRVRRPSPADWPRLRAAGFVPRPEGVAWVAPAPVDDRQFLARLSRKGREDVRRAVRLASGSGLDIEVKDTFDEAFYDQFLVLYRWRIEAMRYGLPVAVRERDRVLGDPDRFFAVAATYQGSLVGACIGERRPERNAGWIRFSAVDDIRRRQSLARVLYLRGSVLIGSEGFATAVLGADPGLYGHVAEIGLLGFKTRLGFTPRPVHEVAGTDNCDVADRILSLKQLADPSVALTYQDSAEQSLTPAVFGTDPTRQADRITLATDTPAVRSIVISQ
ncbi:MAG: hypothetical protein HOW97_29615 [Catenulispora sp.]|nr:hypothetical protein [Catenulispora sp.]